MKSRQIGKPVRLAAAAAPDIVNVLSDAFHDYPVMRFVLGDSPDDYDRRLERLNHLFVMGRVLRNEPLIGLIRDSELCAAATMSYPEKQAVPDGFEDLREAVWEELGPDARSRYEQCVAAWTPLAVDVPQIHLNMIGVRRGLHGMKLGRLLLDEVHEISRNTPRSQGVSLTTELPRNVELYQHMGYEVTGHVHVSPDLETWALFRRD